METLVPLTQVHDVWSSRPSLTNIWSCIHRLWWDLGGRSSVLARGSVPFSPRVPQGLCSDGLCPAARAWEPPAHFYLQFANVGCKTWVETWTKMGSETVSLPSSDPKARRSDPPQRRPASCSPGNGGGLLGVWVVVFGQQRGGKSTASLMFAVVLSFTAPCWSGSAVFSTEFLDKAQFFPAARGRADLRDVTVVYSLPSCDVDSNQALTFQPHLWFSCVLTTRRTTLLPSPSRAAARNLPKIRPSL